MVKSLLKIEIRSIMNHQIARAGLQWSKIG